MGSFRVVLILDGIIEGEFGLVVLVLFEKLLEMLIFRFWFRFVELDIRAVGFLGDFVVFFS